ASARSRHGHSPTQVPRRRSGGPRSRSGGSRPRRSDACRRLPHRARTVRRVAPRAASCPWRFARRRSPARASRLREPCLSPDVTLSRTMADRPLRPPRIELGPGLDVPRVLTGLWQVADMERDGKPLDPDAGAFALREYADAGFDAFDMADHYGSAEILVGRYLARGGRGRAT